MPKTLQKQSVLNGRGNVLLYGSGTSTGKYFYRELIKGTKSYRTRHIVGANSMSEAVELAVDVAFQLAKESSDELQGLPVPKRRDTKGKVIGRKTNKKLISDAVTEWIKEEQIRVDRKLLKQKSLESKRYALEKMLDYLKTKGVSHTNEIDINTFREFDVFRAETTPLQRRAEIKKVKEFCSNYLAVKGLINPVVMMTKTSFPKVIIRQTDLLANPAIGSDDWRTILAYVKGDWKKQSTERGLFFKVMFHHFILFAKNSGFSVEEILKLRWKQIDIVDVGRTNSKGEREKWEVAYISTTRSKTQQTREVPINQARELRRWMSFINSNATKLGVREVVASDLVFASPYRDYEGYSYSHYLETWTAIVKLLTPKLKGHRHSDKNYTLYSLRSSFIEDHLMRGTSVYEVAEMAGHSVIETQKVYAKLDLRRKGRELATPSFGRRQLNEFAVDLFDDNDDD